ncbi:MAG: HAD family hydrolase [Candidatus Izemoplasmatales bacterium]|jgi:HAD superfamily hydrolase (TIGR01549 family)|nr:HAD family hydrolase [Candidatus Izemoplasmatales bacterium]
MITTILFDLDGTLLPLNEELFMKIYFGGLGKTFEKFGYEPKKLIEAVWAGTKSMINNHGQTTNEFVFWPSFYQIVNGDHSFIETTFEGYYSSMFDEVQKSTTASMFSKKIIDELKQKNYRIILATNPLFPRIATEKRIEWAGLKVDDFEFISTYENFSYSKPNIKYFEALIKQLSLTPENCLMIGNDALEDMVASKTGMETYLLTDCLHNEHQVDISKYENGSMEDLYYKLSNFPKLDRKL